MTAGPAVGVFTELAKIMVQQLESQLVISDHLKEICQELAACALLERQIDALGRLSPQADRIPEQTLRLLAHSESTLGENFRRRRELLVSLNGSKARRQQLQNQANKLEQSIERLSKANDAVLGVLLEAAGLVVGLALVKGMLGLVVAVAALAVVIAGAVLAAKRR